MITEENVLSIEKENKINNNEQDENKNQEDNTKKEEKEEKEEKKENEEKDEKQQKKEKKEIIDNELDNMKYEIINEDSQEYDLSFKIIVIGDSGNLIII